VVYSADKGIEKSMYWVIAISSVEKQDEL